MDIELAKAKDGDIEFLVQLRKSTMGEHLKKAGLYLSEEEHLSRVKIHFDSSYVIKEKEEKIGVLKYVETTNTIEVLQFQILSNHQGRGIGNYLLNHMIQLSGSQNKNLTLKVLRENPARHLYERNGFQIIGEDQYEFHMKLIT